MKSINTLPKPKLSLLTLLATVVPLGVSGYRQDAVFDPEPDWIRSGAILASGGISETWDSLDLESTMAHVPHPEWLRTGEPRWSNIQTAPVATPSLFPRFRWPDEAIELWGQSFEDFAEHPEERAFLLEFENDERAWRGIPDESVAGDNDPRVSLRNAEVGVPEWFQEEWLARDTTMQHSKVMNLLARNYARWYAERFFLREATNRREWRAGFVGGDGLVNHILMEGYSAQYFLAAMGVDTVGGAFQPSRVLTRSSYRRSVFENAGVIPIDENSAETDDPRWGGFHYPHVRNAQQLVYRVGWNSSGNLAVRGSIDASAALTARRVIHDAHIPNKFGNPDTWWPNQSFHNPPDSSSFPAVLQGTVEGMLRRWVRPPQVPEPRSLGEHWADVNTHYGVGFFPGGTLLIEELKMRHQPNGERIVRSVEVPPFYVMLLGAFFNNPDDEFWNEEVWDALTRDVHPHRMLAPFEHYRRFPWPKAHVSEGTRTRGILESEWFGRIETLGLRTEWARHESLGYLWTRSFEWGSDHEKRFFEEVVRSGPMRNGIPNPGQIVWPTQKGTGWGAESQNVGAVWAWQPIPEDDPDYGKGRGPGRRFRFFWTDNWERDHYHAQLNQEEWAQPWGVNLFGGPLPILKPNETYPVTIFLESLSSNGFMGYSTLLGQWFITREGMWPWVYSLDSKGLVYVVGGNGDNILWTYDTTEAGWVFHGRYGDDVWAYSFNRNEWTHMGLSAPSWGM